jgi:trimeric autotransporter adhesin
VSSLAGAYSSALTDVQCAVSTFVADRLADSAALQLYHTVEARVGELNERLDGLKAAVRLHDITVEGTPRLDDASGGAAQPHMPTLPPPPPPPPPAHSARRTDSGRRNRAAGRHGGSERVDGGGVNVGASPSTASPALAAAAEEERLLSAGLAGAGAVELRRLVVETRRGMLAMARSFDAEKDTWTTMHQQSIAALAESLQSTHNAASAAASAAAASRSATPPREAGSASRRPSTVAADGGDAPRAAAAVGATRALVPRSALLAARRDRDQARADCGALLEAVDRFVAMAQHTPLLPQEAKDALAAYLGEMHAAMPPSPDAGEESDNDGAEEYDAGGGAAAAGALGVTGGDASPVAGLRDATLPQHLQLDGGGGGGGSGAGAAVTLSDLVGSGGGGAALETLTPAAASIRSITTRLTSVANGLSASGLHAPPVRLAPAPPPVAHGGGGAAGVPRFAAGGSLPPRVAEVDAITPRDPHPTSAGTTGPGAASGSTMLSSAVLRMQMSSLATTLNSLSRRLTPALAAAPGTHVAAPAPSIPYTPINSAAPAVAPAPQAYPIGVEAFAAVPAPPPHALAQSQAGGGRAAMRVEERSAMDTSLSTIQSSIAAIARRASGVPASTTAHGASRSAPASPRSMDALSGAGAPQAEAVALTLAQERVARATAELADFQTAASETAAQLRAEIRRLQAAAADAAREAEEARAAAGQAMAHAASQAGEAMAARQLADQVRQERDALAASLSAAAGSSAAQGAQLAESSALAAALSERVRTLGERLVNTQAEAEELRGAVAAARSRPPTPPPAPPPALTLPPLPTDPETARGEIAALQARLALMRAVVSGAGGGDPAVAPSPLAAALPTPKTLPLASPGSRRRASFSSAGQPDAAEVADMRHQLVAIAARRLAWCAVSPVANVHLDPHVDGMWVAKSHHEAALADARAVALDLQRQADAARSLAAAHEATAAQCQRRSAELEGALSVAQRAAAAAQEEVTAAQAAADAAQAEVLTLREGLASAKESVRALTAADPARQSAVAKVERLALTERALAAATAELQRLRGGVDATASESGTPSDLAGATARPIRSAGDLASAELRLEVARVREAEHAATAESQALRGQLADVLAQMQQSHRVVEAVADLLATCVDVRCTAADLATQDGLARVQAALLARRPESLDSESKGAELAHSQSQVAHLTSQLRLLALQKAALAKELAQVYGAVQVLEGNVDKLTADNARLAALAGTAGLASSARGGPPTPRSVRSAATGHSGSTPAIAPPGRPLAAADFESSFLRAVQPSAAAATGGAARAAPRTTAWIDADDGALPTLPPGGAAASLAAASGASSAGARASQARVPKDRPAGAGGGGATGGVGAGSLGGSSGLALPPPQATPRFTLGLPSAPSHAAGPMGGGGPGGHGGPRASGVGGRR